MTRLAISVAGLLSAVSALSNAAPPSCSLTGPFFYSLDNATVITFGPVQSDGVTYVGTCSSATCGWSHVTATVDAVRPSWGCLQLAFDNGVISAGWLLGADCAENVIYFGGQALYSAQWCRVGNTNCTAPFDPAWTGGSIHMLEVSHSDIGWLGEQDDMLVVSAGSLAELASWAASLAMPDVARLQDAANINASLDMMAADPTFKWQHECIVRQGEG